MIFIEIVKNTSRFMGKGEEAKQKRVWLEYEENDDTESLLFQEGGWYIIFNAKYL